MNLLNTVMLNKSTFLHSALYFRPTAAGPPVGLAYEGRTTFALNMEGTLEPCAHREPLLPRGNFKDPMNTKSGLSSYFN